MKKEIITLALIFVSLMGQAQGIQGDWRGALSINGMKLGLVFHFNGEKATMDSPDQGAKGIPAEIVYNEQDSIAVTVKTIGASYKGRLIDGRIVGRLSQRGMTFPMELTKGEIVRNRPQTPQPPFPYQTEELTFTNEKDGATLAGTLTLPKDVQNPPLVVMVSGSGQQNRDEELFEHKPFAVIADYLARNGIASFRYDDRGVGGSNGLRQDLTTEDFRQDALCALRMIRTKGGSKRIGVLGHSEGGLIAFMIAGEQPKDVDFIVTLAGTAVSGEKVIIGQMKKLTAQGTQVTDEMAKEAIQAASKTNPWYKFFVEYEPTPVIQKIKCPVFALNGTKDVQVIADDNIPALKANLKVKKTDLIKVYEDLNHLFQHAQTGMPEEYGDIEETISEEVLADITNWIKTLK